MADNYIIPANLERTLSMILKPTVLMYEQMLKMSDEELATTMDCMFENENMPKLFSQEVIDDLDQDAEIHEALTGHRISLQKIHDDLKEVLHILEKG